jgi:hypothetical protein
MKSHVNALDYVERLTTLQVPCGIEPIGSPTIIYGDNAACVVQMQSCYMKSYDTKHITLKLFYQHELQVNGEISIL